MPRLRCQISVSLDGFVAGPNPSLQHPVGEGGLALHEWIFALAAWRGPHGLEGGEVNASTPVLEAAAANIGASVMGRDMFGGAGPWDEHPWDGWWGEQPPFRHAVFVVTHYAREPLVLGETSFNFVTDGIEAALERAMDAAGGADVALGGGANVIQQYLRAGLLDELTLHLVPILLGDGTRLLTALGPASATFECTGAVAAPGVTHVTYRIERRPGTA